VSISRLCLSVAILTAGFAYGAQPMPAYAQVQAGDVISGIEIVGNERIEQATVRSYIGLQEGDSFDQANIDRALKGLFGTGLFADVSLSRRGTVLVVRLKENPIINQIAFEGNKKIEDKDLATEVQSKTRAVYTRTRVQNDLQRILDIYRRTGYFAATVTPKIIELDQNRVDLVFEINEGARTYVRSINFIGNEKFTDGQLSEEILTKRERWYRFLSTNDVYDPDRLEVDKELLRRYYLSQGYADFRVVSAVAELSPDNEGFYLTFSIEEGERYKFGTVDVSTTFKDIDVEGLKAELQTKEGKWYDATKVENTVSSLTARLNDMQYAFVDVKPQVQRDREGKLINLTYLLNEGPRVFVERINVNGNMRTQDHVIRRELMLAEGDAFNRSKLKKSEQNIRDLGYFEQVDVKVREGSASDQAVIDVNVAEQSTGEVSIGAGYSTTDGPLADFGLSERNFLGKGQDLRFSTTVSGRSQEFNFSFTEPYFLERDLSAGIDTFHQTRENEESSYDQQNTGFALRMGYPLSENLRQKVSYTLRNTRIENVPATASRYIREQEGERLTSMVGQELSYDRRNSKREPSEGYILRLNTDVAGVGGDANYVKVRGGGAVYLPLAGPDWVMSVLGEAGSVWGMGEDVAISDRFFLGGDTMRGFKTSGIGPRDLTTSEDDSLGGNYFARASMEVTFPIGLPEEMGVKAHAFSDAGTLWGSDADPLPGETFVDDNSIRVSVGAGLSWRSPLGPLRVDLAFPILKEDYDETQQFHLSFGTRF
jgi:outer membrane protein insertion porin family